MKISIIVPVYNLEDYITETLNSIDQQTYSNFECIILNDGSTDKSKEIIEEYVEGKNRFKLITTKNKGVSAARNKGLDYITGEYIYFIDGDDIIPHNALKLLADAAVQHKADIVIGKMMHKRGDTLQEISTYKKYGVNNEGVKTLENNPEILHSIGPTAKLFSKKVIGNYQFPEGRKFAEEHGFVVSAYLKSEKIYGISQLVYNYVVRDKKRGNASATQKFDENVEEYINNLISTHHEVYQLMKDKVSSKVMSYYYFRISEFIMWPLLIVVLRDSQKTTKVNAVLIEYFDEDFHKKMQSNEVFTNVYVRNYIMHWDYETFYNQTQYIDYIKKNRRELPLQERWLLANQSKVKFKVYKWFLKIKNTLLRIYRRLMK